MSTPDPGPLEAIAEWPVANASAAVVGPDGIRHVYGDLDRPYWLASVTKPLFATAVLVAVEEESLALDTPAGPEGATVAHLLSHASGLGLDGGEMAKPGRRRIYSNAAFNVLGTTLAGACDLAPATYLAEAVLGPLGMDATSLDGSPASGATSTVTDLARWVGELLRPQLLAAETVAAARTVAFPGLDGLVPGYGKQTPCDWGLGFEIKGTKSPHWTAPGGDPGTYGHFGRSGTFVWIDPHRDVALVVLTDREFEAWAKPLWPVLSEAVLTASP
jgi:CubicO group peptidase (beta-lactamase class C family)